MSDTDTKEYVVIAANALKYKMGEIVNLTEKRAAFLINKVRPRDEHDAKKSAGRPTNQQKKIDQLEAEGAKMAERLEDGNAIMSQLLGANPALVPTVEALKKELDAKRAAAKLANA